MQLHTTLTSSLQNNVMPEKKQGESVVKDVSAKLGHNCLVEALVKVHHARGSSVGGLPCKRLAGHRLRCWHAALQTQSALKAAECLQVKAPQCSVGWRE